MKHGQKSYHRSLATFASAMQCHEDLVPYESIFVYMHFRPYLSAVLEFRIMKEEQDKTIGVCEKEPYECDQCNFTKDCFQFRLVLSSYTFKNQDLLFLISYIIKYIVIKQMTWLIVFRLIGL